MTQSQLLITIVLFAIGTMITRFLPFIIFPESRTTPKFVIFLGKYLPAAVIGMLVIYCIKDVSILTGTHGLPELISIAVIVLLHVWKRQVLLSVGVGTVLYMLLVQFVFV